MPESDDPPPPQSVPESKAEAHAAEISEGQYHELADEYLETILSKFEELADEREDVDVEFAVCSSLPFPSISLLLRPSPRPPNFTRNKASH